MRDAGTAIGDLVVMSRSSGDHSGAPRRRRVSASARYRLAEIVLAVVVVGAGLAFGGQHLPVLICLYALLTVAAVLMSSELDRIPAIAWLAFALAGFTALQTLPLPRSLVAALSPGSARIWADAFVPLAQSAPAWIPLSIDPGATSVQALVWFGYGLAFTVCVAVRGRRGSDWLAALAFIAALCIGGVTLLHGALGLERVYGFYLPRSGGTHRWALGPFLNSNNLAGYLNAGIFAGLGLLASGRGPVNPLLLRTGLFVLIVQSILAGSRAGVFTLALGLLVFGALFGRRQSASLGRGLVLVLAGLAVALVLGGDALVRLLGEREFERKTHAWGWSLAMLRDFPAFGVGRGAFETAFPPYRGSFDADWNAVFSHPENIVIQWVVEWGVPAAVVAALVAAVLVLPALQRARHDLLAACLLLGLGVLVLQNLADLGLELPAMGLLATVALAGAGTRSMKPLPRSAPLRPALLAAGAVAAAAMALVRDGYHTVQNDRLHVAAQYQQLRQGSASRDEVMAELDACIHRHPGEPYFAVIGGLIALGDDDRRALRWAARALERAPVSGQAHMLTAAALRARGATDQALTHLRWAAVYDGELRGHAFDRAAAWTDGDPQRLVRAFPPNVPGANLLAAACRRLAPPQQIACLAEVLDRPGNDQAAEQLADLVWPALWHRAAPCDAARDWCLTVFDRVRAKLAGSARPGWRSEQVSARLLLLKGEQTAAIERHLAACAKADVPHLCHESALNLALLAPNPALIARAVKASIDAACPGIRDCAAAHDQAAAAFEQTHARAQALHHRSAAADAEPTFERWAAVARAAFESGLRPVAERALDRAERMDDASPEQLEGLAALKARAVAGQP